MIVHFDIGRQASKGARPYQEDAAAVWPGTDDLPGPPAELAGDACLVAVLADGMGGHVGGALASLTVCASFIDGFAHDRSSTRDRLRAGLTAANRAIELKVEEQPQLAGMGSTLIGASFGSGGLEWVSVGDSPLYLFRRGEIALINEDHSLAPALDELAASGKITHAQARSDPRRHMLRSAITGEDLDLVDLSKAPLIMEQGDFVVLASDGIHALETSEIARIIAAYADDGPQAISAALIRSVDNVRDPHQDNTTVITVSPSRSPAMPGTGRITI